MLCADSEWRPPLPTYARGAYFVYTTTVHAACPWEAEARAARPHGPLRGFVPAVGGAARPVGPAALRLAVAAFRLLVLSLPLVKTLRRNTVQFDVKLGVLKP